MSTNLPSDFVFVDFENVPDPDRSAIRSQLAHMTLLIGKNQKKIDRGLVNQIQVFAVPEAFVEVGASG